MRILIALLLVLLLASCGEKRPPVDQTEVATNKPYKIAGQWYYPILKADGYDEKGIASWYGEDFHGKATSSGEPYDMHALSAAHPTLPMGTKVRVTNLENGKSMILRINDRGPFVKSRLIDLSYAAAKELGYADKGTARVRVQAVGEGDNNVEVVHYNAPPVEAAVAPLNNDSATVPPAVEDQPVVVTPVRDLADVNIISPAAAAPAVASATTMAAPAPVAPAPAYTAPATTLRAAMRGSYVQIGAFSTLENAEQLRRDYADRFPALQIFTTSGQLPVMYKVRQGPFASRAEAEAIASRMELAGIPRVTIAQDIAQTVSGSGQQQDIPAPLSSASPAMTRTFVAPSAASPATPLNTPPAAVVTPASGMYVQIGAFSTLQRAQQLKDRYASVYTSTRVYAPQPGEQPIYRVRIGPLQSPQEAAALVDQLEANGIEKAVIVVEN